MWHLMDLKKWVAILKVIFGRIQSHQENDRMSGSRFPRPPFTQTKSVDQQKCPQFKCFCAQFCSPLKSLVSLLIKILTFEK